MAARKIQNLAIPGTDVRLQAHGSSLPATKGEGEVLSMNPDAILREEYRDLVRRHLKRLPALFRRFTGLAARLVWAPPWPCRWSAADLPTRSSVCRSLTGAESVLLGKCRDCAAQHLAKALQAGKGGHYFTCFLGVHNFWQPIIVRGTLVGLAFVQAPVAIREGARARGNDKARQGRIARGSRKPPKAAGRELQSVGRIEFSEAARLLQLVFRHAETAALADLRKADLTQAQRALVELQTVATRLRVELNGLVPAFNKVGPVLRTGKVSDTGVRAALAYIYSNFSQPLTLKQCAQWVGLNAAYLSALFSRSIGVPFKTYLTEVRMEKARELLSDPTKAVADVALAVGYASENRFRIAFKNVNGLCPSLWRETLRMQPNQEVPLLRR